MDSRGRYTAAIGLTRKSIRTKKFTSYRRETEKNRGKQFCIAYTRRRYSLSTTNVKVRLKNIFRFRLQIRVRKL